MSNEITAITSIEDRIFTIRGQKVMIDKDLAEHDETIRQIIGVLNNLIDKPRETKKIGFDTGN